MSNATNDTNNAMNDTNKGHDDMDELCTSCGIEEWAVAIRWGLFGPVVCSPGAVAEAYICDDCADAGGLI